MEIKPPVIFCYENERIPDTGLVLDSRQCHSCGMENVENINDHDILMNDCPWSLYRKSKKKKNGLSCQLTCPICCESLYMVLYFQCNHIICLKCLMSLDTFKCPFRCENKNENKVFYMQL